MRRLYLVCLVLIFLIVGCNSNKISEPQIVTTPPSGVTTQEPPKPPTPPVQPPNINPGQNYPDAWAKLPENKAAILTLRSVNKEIEVSLSPSYPALVPLDKGGYEAELIINKRCKVSGFPQVESKTWRFLKNSGANWETEDGEKVFRFHISSSDGFVSEEPPTTPLDVPVIVSLHGVLDGEQTVSLIFPFTVEDPQSKYGIIHQGKVIDDDKLRPSRPEWVNGNLELVVFALPNEHAADYHVALCNTELKQMLFVADLKTFSGFAFWMGWLNDKEFYVANNYNLMVYHIYGEKREIMKLSSENHRNAIHGLAWSKETQTMAVLHCDGNTDGIELKLLTNKLKASQTVAVVDKQDWYRGGSERFPMQVAPMAWDDKGERLAFTKAKEHTLAIYDRKTGAIEDITGVNASVSITYDPATNQFLTNDNYQ